MTAGWVAGSVRARAMARRVLGAEAARQLAASRSLPEAQRMLQQTPFRGAAEVGLSLAAAQHAVAETILWDMRVLAGWLPRDGVSLLRLLAAYFEIANVDELLQTLAGRPSDPEFQLGALATAWPRLSETTSMVELRHALAASAWGDPGGDSSRDIRLAMRARWAARVVASGDRARAWATASTGLLHSAEPSGDAAAATSRDGTAGQPSARARLATPGRRRQALPGQPRTSAAAGRAAESWQAEVDWWRRVEADGRGLLRSSASDSDPVLGTVVVMAADARRVRAALACAARGGLALEAYDAVA
jgi:hypothetical protein